MKKEILIVLTFLFGSTLYGQDYVQKELNLLKNETSLSQLKFRVDSLTKLNRPDKAEYKTNSRTVEILNDYSETSISISVSIPHDTPVVYRYLPFRFCIINKGDLIVYCKLREVGYYPDEFEKTLFSYDDNKHLSKFHADYESFYSCKINPDDFFLKSDVYGKSCTEFHEPPKSREIIENKIAKKDTTFINSWLGSPTIEKQVYAVEALSRLKRLGMKLSDRQEKLMTFIKNRNVTVSVCNGGCSNLSLSPKKALEYFK
jgi:hypothetical protein